MRNVSFKLRNLSLELRNLSLELRNLSLELRNVSLSRQVPTGSRQSSHRRWCFACCCARSWYAHTQPVQKPQAIQQDTAVMYWLVTPALQRQSAHGKPTAARVIQCGPLYTLYENSQWVSLTELKNSPPPALHPHKLQKQLRRRTAVPAVPHISQL